jgi:hypothetical protein
VGKSTFPTAPFGGLGGEKREQLLFGMQRDAVHPVGLTGKFPCTYKNVRCERLSPFGGYGENHLLDEITIITIDTNPSSAYYHSVTCAI